MKKLSPTLVFGFLGLATFASLVGTVSGTLAWYAYNTRTTISYSGTSVENSVQLQIGLASDTLLDIDNEDWDAIMGEPELIDGEYCYFAPLGHGLNSAVINAYLGVKGYATRELCPITSGYYDPTDSECDFSLKEAPTVNHPKTDISASHTNYLKLPFVFRATKSKTAVGDYVEGQEIWLTDAKGAASNASVDGNVYKAMRVFFDRKDADYSDGDFILNPAASSVDGETKVGGVLDLTKDSYYDTNENGEIFFGEWDESTLANPSSLWSENVYEAPNPNPIYNMNGDGGVVEKANTFNSRHRDGLKYYTHDALNNIPVKTAKYMSLASIKPERSNVDGHLENKEDEHPTSVCITGGSALKYAGRVDAYIWLEGWDFAVVDEEQRHAFDFGLTFEINKVGS